MCRACACVLDVARLAARRGKWGWVHSLQDLITSGLFPWSLSSFRADKEGQKGREEELDES